VGKGTSGNKRTTEISTGSRLTNIFDIIVDTDEKTIYPKWDNMVEAMNWAEQYPSSFTVYTVGLIGYYSEKDLTMFLVKWG